MTASPGVMPWRASVSIRAGYSARSFLPIALPSMTLAVIAAPCPCDSRVAHRIGIRDSGFEIRPMCGTRSERISSLESRISNLVSAKNDCLGLIREHAALRVPLDGAIQHHALEICTDRHELLGRHRVIHARDLLLDDRTFVEIGRDVVRGGADQFHTTRVR